MDCSKLQCKSCHVRVARALKISETVMCYYRHTNRDRSLVLEGKLNGNRKERPKMLDEFKLSIHKLYICTVYFHRHPVTATFP